MKKDLLYKLFNTSQKLVFVGLICFLSFNINGQVTIHEEYFDGSLGSWTEYSVTGDEVWEPYEFDMRQFVRINNFIDGEWLENEDWLISPALNLNEYSDEVLNFDNAANFEGPELKLFYSTDYDGSSDPSTNGNWTDITDQANWSPGGFEFVSSGDIDLSGISGDAVYIAVQYIGTTDTNGGKIWEFDDVTVVGNATVNTFDPVNEQIITIPSIYNNTLNFEITAPSKDLTFELHNFNGQQLGYYTSAQLGTQARISVDQLPQGMYVLVVRMDDQIRGYKIMNQ